MDDFSTFVWNRDYLNELITQGKHRILENKDQIDAFLKVDRADFVSEDNHKDAYADIEVDIGYGQKMNKPTVVAEQIKLLNPKKGGRYLDVGAGTGYTAVLIALIVGEEGKVIAIERNLNLIHLMRENLKKYKELEKIIEIEFKDGIEGDVSQAPYNGILVSFAYEEIPEKLKKQLKIDGRIVAPTKDNDIRVLERKSTLDFVETIYPGYIFESVMEGVE